MFKSRTKRKVAAQKASRQDLKQALGDEWKDLCDPDGLDTILSIMSQYDNDTEIQER